MSVRESAYQKIVEICCMQYGKKPEDIHDETNFVEDLGAKSGNISQMVNFLEDAFDIEIPFMKFRRKRTVGECADYIEELCSY